MPEPVPPEPEFEMHDVMDSIEVVSEVEPVIEVEMVAEEVPVEEPPPEIPPDVPPEPVIIVEPSEEPSKEEDLTQNQIVPDFEPGYFFNEQVEPEPSSLAPGLSRPSTGFTLKDQPLPSPVAYVKVIKERPEPELYDATLMMKRWNKRQQHFLQQQQSNVLTALTHYSLTQTLQSHRLESQDVKSSLVARARILQKLGKLASEERKRQLLRSAERAPWRDAVWSAPAALQGGRLKCEAGCGTAPAGLHHLDCGEGVVDRGMGRPWTEATGRDRYRQRDRDRDRLPLVSRHSERSRMESRENILSHSSRLRRVRVNMAS
ncbi:hypothetical protein HK097_008049 [Rhizophlyctis rosea]|uniref:Uncharacterized protein n=1 Tax=Rhizophlyctis rosea TaxID=64517 RepID=A0AAD5SQ73_9FUNG|nr:hypothetical protein HK097_008049 [Rhizophlyctis rosea]